MGGEVSGIKITEIFLFAVSFYIAIASVMVFLSLVLAERPPLDQHRAAGAYIGSIVASAIGETSAYFVLLSVVESALLLLIIWYAWT
jgi:hypothetical protein